MMKETLALLIKQTSGNQRVIAVNVFYVDLLDGDINTAILLNQVIYWSDHFNGTFYKKDKQWSEEVRMTKRQLNRCKKKLETLGLTTITVKKDPHGAPTCHYNFHMDKLLKMIESHTQKVDEASGDAESDKTSQSKVTKGNNPRKVTKGDNGKLQNVTFESNKRSLSSYKEDVNKEDVNKEELKEEVNKDIVFLVINYLNQKANKRYKHTTKSTIKHINARVDEGFELQDFYDVIDAKCRTWLGTKWEKYLRPATLFNSEKFEGYLNELPAKGDHDGSPGRFDEYNFYKSEGENEELPY